MLNKDKRYLFTIRSLTGGGAERVVSVLASHMAEADYDVSIVVYGRNEKDYPISSKVKVYCMPTRKNNLFGKLKRIPDMMELVSKIQPSVVIPFVGTVLFVSYFACLRYGIPIIRTIRISPWMEEGNALQIMFRRYINEKAAAIMVQNQEQAVYFPPSMRSKVFVVPNPISDSFLAEAKGEYREQIKEIVTLGRLTKQKNHALLISAFSKICQENSLVRLTIYGNGPEFDNLAEQIRSLGIENRCRLMERTTDALNVLKDADLFVMTSDFEGMPNALMEAMALGVPCISSDCQTGPKEMISHRFNGVLFKTGDENDLVNQINWCLNQGKQLKSIGKAARSHILSEYTYERVCEKMMRMLHYVENA